MNEILDHRLFRVGGAPVTVGSLLAFVAILLASYLLARLTRRLVVKRFLTHRLTVGVRYALGRFVGYLIFLLGAAVALETLGISIAALAAFGAALGVGIGFGLQDIAKNFVSGLILLVERPIQVGDRINLGDVSGDVVEIRTRATIIRTNDDVHLIIPNSKFISETVTNRSYGQPRVRYRIPVGVAYGSDPRAVEEALLEAARKSENVLADPPPSVRFKAFGDSSFDFELLCWTSRMLQRQGAFRSELNFAIYEALKARGIEIPFPQRDLHIRSAQGLEPFLRGGMAPEEPARKVQETEAEEKP
jgi:small-conductance mechanosensitive channel